MRKGLIALFKVASFNANSVRARLPVILEWLNKEAPDVLCLQETKAEDKDFPAAEFEAAGYRCAFKGQKGRNGVAVLSRHPLEVLHRDGPAAAEPGEARLLAVKVQGVHVVNTYVPQGREPDTDYFRYKLAWIRSLRDFFSQHYTADTPLLWCGDFNVAPEPIDVHNPKGLLGHVGFHPEEHLALRHVKDWGFVDVFRRHVDAAGEYTFWDYRAPNGFKRNLGWRVDHIWATPALAGRSRRAFIDREPRAAARPSDHTFVAAEFEL